MPELVVMVEEESMRALLDALLPDMLPDGWHPIVIPHQGKSDLEQSIPRKLGRWRDPNARFIVMRDNDRGNCLLRKQRLLDLVRGTGCEDATKARIVCQELESWIIGDIEALEAALGPASRKMHRLATNPDDIDYPAEMLERHYGSYSKVSGAEQVGGEMDPNRNTSPSFRAFLCAVEVLTTGEA